MAMAELVKVCRASNFYVTVRQALLVIVLLFEIIKFINSSINTVTINYIKSHTEACLYGNITCQSMGFVLWRVGLVAQGPCKVLCRPKCEEIMF